MPRPLSMTVTELSTWMMTSIWLQIPGQGLVDAVVDDLVDQVMKALDSGAPDVHGRALAHGLESLEDLDAVRGIFFFFHARYL